MADETVLSTVFRSTDRTAETDATVVKNLLQEAGLHPVLLEETELGVNDGRWEIRVPADEAEEAKDLLESANEGGPDTVDTSSDLDLVTIASTDGALSEMEAASIQSILDASGINCIVVGTPTLPNLGFEVRVAKDDLERAQEVLREAQAAGPAAAEAEAENSAPTE